MPLKLGNDIVVSEEYRKIFSKKPDVIITKETQLLLLSSKTIITVGDVVTNTVLRMGMIPKVSVVDLKTKRENAITIPQEKYDKVLKVRNPPGVISRDMWNLVEEAMRISGNVLIVVEGEEDLASLPAIYFSPKGSIILYGIPDVGIALIESGEQIKSEIEKYIKDMGGGVA